MHRENGKWIPNYVIKSPRECKSVIVDPEDLKYRVLMIHKDKKDLKGTNVLKYIHEGETRVFGKGKKSGIPSQKPTCVSRKPRWYDLGVWEKPDFAWADAYNDRYGVYDTSKTWADKRFFYITLQNKENFVMVHSYMNSSVIPLMIEINGITNLGEGAVYTNVYWLEKLGVPQKDRRLEEKLRGVLNKLKSRKILSIFQEVGANTPEEVSLDKVKPDRRELDKIVMGEILGLTEDEQLEVYRAVVDLVGSRIERARSVKRGL